MLFKQKYTPRWLIFSIDLIIVLFSILSAYLLRFNFNVPEEYISTLKWVVPMVLMIRSLGFSLGKTYAGIIRYTSSKDAERILLVTSISSMSIFLINIISFFLNNNYFLIPLSVIIIDFLLTIFLLIVFRIAVKSLYTGLNLSEREQKNVIIYGADELGMTTKGILEKSTETSYKTVAFIDDLKARQKQHIGHAKVYCPDHIAKITERHKVTSLIFAKKDIPVKIKNEIIDFCLNQDIKVQNVPNVTHWINGELSVNQIKSIKIEDLLQREPIQLDVNAIKSDLLGKTILVTGAAGSIGSEIVRQLTQYSPKRIVLYDQAESPLYDLELFLQEEAHFQSAEIVIGDVRDTERLDFVFKQYQPSVVYHAAAYKHVPMMEKNPIEAISTNVFGTKNVAEYAVKYKVSKFVLVSTDKAVNPTNVMGASKRIAEIFVQSLNQKSDTQFITTRFGNVLGSNGSVIPRFKKQIEKGGPVTITHPEITRFFMTIPEACQLVLEAGSTGNGGEIFVFDMGQSVKILDLAKKMIKLYGLKLGIDIKIEYTGLRPGEKLYEELLNVAENTIPTHHPKILKAKVREYALEAVQNHFTDLEKSVATNDVFKVVAKMKQIVPEFISKNSLYESLDQ